MVNHKAGGPKDLASGAALQCVEAATLGMPFEVWKTRMGRHRSEGTLEAFSSIWRSRGLGGFWQGTSAKLLESASKGAVLLYSKETLLKACRSLELSNSYAGFIAGAGGGACQTLVMGPCTFAVTALVTGEEGVKISEKFRSILKTHGIRGGALATWNQPFEVARIQMQSAAAEGQPRENIIRVRKKFGICDPLPLPQLVSFVSKLRLPPSLRLPASALHGFLSPSLRGPLHATLSLPILSWCLAVSLPILSWCLAASLPILSWCLAVSLPILSWCLAVSLPILSWCLAVSLPTLSWCLAASLPRLLRLHVISRLAALLLLCVALTDAFR
ncbi:mitochondrial carrier [Cyclospora cayetanensis]|uniref:Mitochondrial carrier n=1 Tax=Cyclospora cayetanensis TaxID=88456 RepID=A0A1D3CUM9_9EIME|nr:mitochondrial carrier [Cyclospora cayetanensis]